MKWKEFFKPTKGKIIIFVIISLFIFGKIFLYEDLIIRQGYPSTGYPLPFYNIINLGVPGGPVGPLEAQPNFVNLAINLIFWYLISCLIFWGYNKVKK